MVPGLVQGVSERWHILAQAKISEFTIQVPGSLPGSGWFRLIYTDIMSELFNSGVKLIFCVAVVKLYFQLLSN